MSITLAGKRVDIRFRSVTALEQGSLRGQRTEPAAAVVGFVVTDERIETSDGAMKLQPEEKLGEVSVLVPWSDDLGECRRSGEVELAAQLRRLADKLHPPGTGVGE